MNTPTFFSRTPSRTRQPAFYGLESLVERVLRDPFLAAAQGDLLNQAVDWTPSMDVAETESGITVKMEVPGVDPEQLDINISGHTLTVQGEKAEESEENRKGFYHSERRFGSFKRVIELPKTVNPDSVTAEHKNGIVTISLKKSANGNAKKVTVTAAQ